MDQKISITSEKEGDGYYIAQFKSFELAIFSYYVQSDKECFLIDPTFDVKAYNDLIAKRNSTLKYICLTHYHADFLSGHTQFKVPVIMGQGSKRSVNSFEVIEHLDGAVFTIGNISVQVIHTPGHTLQSSCFLLSDAKKVPSCLFSGDTVFIGEVGRPDLAGSQKISTSDLAGMLYDSIQKIKKLDVNITLLPAHGSGSACGKSIGAGNSCTLGNQHTGNYGFKFETKEQFIKGVTDGIPKPPSYFFHDAKINQVGPTDYSSVIKTSNIPLSVQEFGDLSLKIPVVDTRSEVGPGILKNSYWLSSKGAISNWIANILKPEEEFIIICDEGKSEDIIERFLRIGYFQVKGYNNFKIEEWKGELVRPTVLNFKQFAEEKQFLHLDVRSKGEWQSTGIPHNAILIPLPELETRVEELRGKEHLVINCRVGLRARVAFSILAKHGIISKVLSQTVDNFEANGIKLEKYLA